MQNIKQARKDDSSCIHQINDKSSNDFHLCGIENPARELKKNEGSIISIPESNAKAPEKCFASLDCREQYTSGLRHVILCSPSCSDKGTFGPSVTALRHPL